MGSTSDQVVAQQLIQGIEIVINHRLEPSVFQLFNLRLDGIAHSRASL
jgi:hypothetical protein